MDLGPAFQYLGLQICLAGSGVHPFSGTCGRGWSRSSQATHSQEHLPCAFMAAATATAAASLLLPSPLSFGFQTSPKLYSIGFHVRRAPSSPYKYPISASLSSPNSSSWDREEQRWLREEQRWLREEQRWIRDEQRWNSERESLLREIAELKLRIQALELEKQKFSASLVTDAVSNLASILQALKESEANLAATAGRIAESGSGAGPLLLEQEEVKEMILEEIKVPESVGKVEEEEEKKPSLRIGSEGEGVREMQVCMLQIWRRVYFIYFRLADSLFFIILLLH